MGAPEATPRGANDRGDEPVDVADVLGDDETYAATDHTTTEAPGPRRRSRRRPGAATPTGPKRRFGTRQVAAILLVLGVVIGVYGAGRPAATDQLPEGHPEVSSMPTTEAVDAQLEAELVARLQEDPKDVDAMRRLGTLYYGAGDYVRTAQWQEQILTVAPEDVDALLALGVAEFSVGDLEGAEQHWNAALEVNPDQAEVHYNLGFLHLSQDDPAQALVAWDRVVELEPDSDMATTIASHRDALVTQAATTSEED